MLDTLPLTPTAWLTPHQAATRLNLTTQWVRMLADRGVLRTVRTPLGRLIDAESVDDLVRVRAAASKTVRP